MLKSSKFAQAFSTVFDLELVYVCEFDVLHGGFLSHDEWALSSAIGPRTDFRPWTTVKTIIVN